ncbi:gliding motility-associated C-terminal domain-containing protein [Lutibacter holmesii]|uniref:Gliding motility-associated C-terminal domain-containing protein n=1 Tax=Lutibacter holmesii TaxID=1137985 RepID=A0ABW3WJ37_9FLAO
MTITRTWTATDAFGNSVSEDQIITVVDTIAPELSAMPIDISVSCVSEVPGSQNIMATDSCDIDVTVVFEQSELPTCSGEVINTWTATDYCGNTTSYTQKVTIDNDIDPVFSGDLPVDLTVECNEIPDAAELRAIDACGNYLEVDYVEEIIGEEDGCANNYRIKRVWSTKDCSENIMSYTQIITVVDTTAPVIVDAPESTITVSCSEIPEPGVITATDNCSSEVQINFEESITGVELTGYYQIIRLWTITDECNNTSMYTQTINVEPLNYSGEEETNVCVEDGIIDLDSLISGVPADDDGTWSDDDNSGALSGSEFDPSFAAIGSYHFTYTSGYDTCVTTYTVLINVNDDCVVRPCESPQNITISKIVTANNDGINDTLEISDVFECGFVPEIKIFNRWGKQVYESNNYQNNWGGYHDNSGPTVGTGNKLPTGTYYYIVNVRGSGFQPITGHIYLGTN